MGKVEAAKDKLAEKTKRLVGEVLGDQKLDEEGKAQQRNGDEEAGKPAKPLGNLDQLT